MVALDSFAMTCAKTRVAKSAELIEIIEAALSRAHKKQMAKGKSASYLVIDESELPTDDDILEM